MKKILFLSLAVAGALNAVTIKSVTYKGLMHLSNEVANDISGLKIGDELSETNSKSLENERVPSTDVTRLFFFF